jgi:hypothetical protein
MDRISDGQLVAGEQKITLDEMRSSGFLGPLLYSSDYRCSIPRPAMPRVKEAFA